MVSFTFFTNPPAIHTVRVIALWLLAGAIVALGAAPGQTLEIRETPGLEALYPDRALPPTSARIPTEPLVVDLESRGRTPGAPGGEIDTLTGNGARDWFFAKLGSPLEDDVTDDTGNEFVDLL